MPMLIEHLMRLLEDFSEMFSILNSAHQINATKAVLDSLWIGIHTQPIRQQVIQ